MTSMSANVRLAEAKVEVELRADGSQVLRSPTMLGSQVRVVSDWLEQWSKSSPQRTLFAERQNGEWVHLTYGEAYQKVLRLAAGLLQLGLGPQRPLMILSENSIQHALLTLAAMHVGVPVAPISPAYSLLSHDHEKLRSIAQLLRPGAVFASDPNRYAKALQALGTDGLSVQQLLQYESNALVHETHAKTTPDTVAKVMFTSGSTGIPKGVMNTQRMLTANQRQSLHVWPFLGDTPPVVVDWLPWNHTFGGNYNFNMVLSNGGTMYIDAGKPVPALFGETLRNLREISPSVYFNVPKGFDLLLPHLEEDAVFRKMFFERCKFIFYAGAALAQSTWDRIQRLARLETGSNVMLVSAWGATETAPLCAAVHFPIERAGVVGLPVPGCEIKLIPTSGKMEARVRGPNITPGYYNSPEMTQAAFDEEGFYRIGDALKLLEPQTPEKGLVFDGRVAEDFKLRTGTWVHVGALRVQLITACDPLVQDAVLTGHDRDEIGALLFLHPSAASMPEAAVQTQISKCLARLNEAATSSMRIARVLVQMGPPRADAGEITDKGYLNQRQVLSLRHDQVERLHASVADQSVIFPHKETLSTVFAS
ncbi:feruloyl-CoA synthase [Comamonas sp. Tr-654]|uniref:feruloyl-CoA synthase n=1 Tax=Comamonas sp. Tr-654 TaxID=2608341 RepID=UPI001423DA90|nr:feruloyl-CoA synthase [Comamonas sp. Tr-654]NIF82694.1 feruloyl-CoA synthase [Comamonas sp. Tr-654]